MNAQESTDLVDADDVLAATETVAAMLEASAAHTAGWDEHAGTIEWTCRRTLAHVADCATWYAANLARESTHSAEVGELAPTAAASVLVDALRSGGALLAAAVNAARPEQRGYHPFGIADRSGFSAMGCDEILVHGADIAAGLGIGYEPPADVCAHVVSRLFPWAPTDTDPWTTLQWANGRAALGARQPETRWLWHCAPLSEWDGLPRRASQR